MEKNIIEQMRSFAIQAADNAYTDYYEFPVGACIQTSDDNYFLGCNVQNASFPVSTCAEASAVSNMILHGQRIIKSVAVYAPKMEYCAPCGGCRQIIREFASADTKIILFGSGDNYKAYTMDELLPGSFSL